MHGHVVGQLRRPVRQHDEHAVDAATTLHMEVAVDHLPGLGLQPDDAPDLDLLLERDPEVLQAVLALLDRVDAFRRHDVGQFLRLELEVLGAGDEVGLALQLDHRADTVLHDQRDDALGVLPVLALRAGGQALLTQPLRGCLGVAVVGLEGALGVHHPGTRRLAQCLYVLGGERHRDLAVSSSW